MKPQFKSVEDVRRRTSDLGSLLMLHTARAANER
jgi:hypothetical protein